MPPYVPLPRMTPLPRTTHQPLLGMRMGMVCGDEGAPAPSLFKQVALELGAQVTVLDPGRMLEEGAALEEIARLLGQLYGAVACDDLPPAVLRRLTAAAVVPVMAVQAVLAPPDGRSTTDGAERRRVAQAALLAALG